MAYLIPHDLWPGNFPKPRPELWTRLREHGLELEAVSEMFPGQFTIHFTSSAPQLDIDIYHRTLEKMGYEDILNNLPYMVNMVNQWPDPLDGNYRVTMMVRKEKIEMKLYWTHEEKRDLNAGEAEAVMLLRAFKLDGDGKQLELKLDHHSVSTLNGMAAVWHGLNKQVGENPFNAIIEGIRKHGVVTVRLR